MYRVELKVEKNASHGIPLDRVPNVPCGVESKSMSLACVRQGIPVPNVPCGVES